MQNLQRRTQTKLRVFGIAVALRGEGRLQEGDDRIDDRLSFRLRKRTSLLQLRSLDARADLDRFQGELLFEVALGARDDEADVMRETAAGEREPESRAAPLEVGQEDGVVDVAECVEVAEDDLPGDDVPAIRPTLTSSHASL